MRVPFSKPAKARSQDLYLSRVAQRGEPWGGGEFSKLAESILQHASPASDVLLTQSCSSALELAGLALGIGAGDEVIVPSYTFVTTASSFALRGARLIFVDSESRSLNIDVGKIESLITSRTKAIVAVHYGGVACDMQSLLLIARKYGLFLIEDAAQGVGSVWGGKALGTIGDLGCVSFHGTKNISCGEGGALYVNTSDPRIRERARIAHEKGTDRARFLRGEIDKYTWRALGGSFTPSEFTAAVLFAQLEVESEITTLRRQTWWGYFEVLSKVVEEFATVIGPLDDGSNAHMFALMLREPSGRSDVLRSLRDSGIVATSHYEPLHLSPFVTEDASHDPGSLPVAEWGASSILRLPMWSEKGLSVELVSAELLKALRSSSR